MEISGRSLLGLGTAGFHRVAYTQWGRGHNKRVVICVHGLTRNGCDFDDLNLALSDYWRVLCPDMLGHGNSDWLADPTGYNEPQYLSDCMALIARSGAVQVDWIGTSMGGLLGMVLAAQPNTPLRRLVLNDVGPFTPKAALERIWSYVSKAPIFPDLTVAEAYLYKTNVHFFGHLTESQWQRMARSMTRPRLEGGYCLHYDPGVVLALRTGILTDLDLWTVWETVRCPVLVLRGQMSDMLTAETAGQMKVRGPGAMVVDIPDCGHAPALMDEYQIRLLRAFLTTD